MSFKEVIVAGVNLVREAIQSPNFITGLSGWRIARNGDAEFNNLAARGSIQIGGTPPAQSITGGIINGQPQFDFYSGAPSETGPAKIFADASGTDPEFVLQSGAEGNGMVEIIMVPPTATTVGVIDVATKNVSPIPGKGSIAAAFEVSAEYQTFLLNNNKIATGLHPLTLGTGGQIMEFDNGGIQTFGGPLALNPFGLSITCPAMRHLHQRDVSGPYTVNTGTFSNPTAISIAALCPASGIVTLFYKCVVQTQGAAGNTNPTSIFIMSAQVVNATAGTTPYSPSNLDGSRVQGGMLSTTSNAANPVIGTIQNFQEPTTVTGFVTVSGLGNDGEALVLTPQFLTLTSGSWSISNILLVAIPSP